MKINANVNGEEIFITLTKDQLAEIARQTKNQYTIQDIIDCKTDDDACKLALEILGMNSLDYFDKMYFEDYNDEANSKLKIIIKAVNYLDNNNQIWKADFNDKSYYKYYPWFEKVSSGWSLRYVDGYIFGSGVPVGFFYKNNQSANLIVRRFIILYNKWLGV